MSFILDALKKSEAERNRQSGPTLIDMRIAPPRRRLPIWIIALTVILLANFAVLAIVLLRSPADGTDAPPPGPNVPALAAATAPAATPAPLPAPADTYPSPPANALPPPALVETAPPVAPVPSASPQPGQGGRPASTDEFADLPSAEELRLDGVAVPELRLALHVYDANPAVRYMLLNSQRMREGDATNEGIRLERITETGAVLSWNGRRFVLKPGQ